MRTIVILNVQLWTRNENMIELVLANLLLNPIMLMIHIFSHFLHLSRNIIESVIWIHLHRMNMIQLLVVIFYYYCFALKFVFNFSIILWIECGTCGIVKYGPRPTNKNVPDFVDCSCLAPIHEKPIYSYSAFGIRFKHTQNHKINCILV